MALRPFILSTSAGALCPCYLLLPQPVYQLVHFQASSTEAGHWRPHPMHPASTLCKIYRKETLYRRFGLMAHIVGCAANPLDYTCLLASGRISHKKTANVLGDLDDRLLYHI